MEWRWGQYGALYERGGTVHAQAPTLSLPVGVEVARGFGSLSFAGNLTILDPAAFLQYDAARDGRLPGAKLLTAFAPGLATRFGLGSPSEKPAWVTIPGSPFRAARLYRFPIQGQPQNPYARLDPSRHIGDYRSMKPRSTEAIIDAPPHAGGSTDLVVLDPDHPGFRDQIYRHRRNTIAQLALSYLEGNPVPRVEYTEREHEVWRTVWTHLEALHEEHACSAYLEASDRIQLDRVSIPQLEDVNTSLGAQGEFRMLPVAGLVTDRTFLGYLARSRFLSTQYMRHHATPLYTPEPDVIHELVGHAATFADPRIAELNRAFGRAALRADDATLSRIARIYWYTLEFGVIAEHGRPKALGAGLLSSFGELGRFRLADLRPLDLAAISARPYDPTQYQDVLFVAPSLNTLVEQVGGWLERAAG